MKADKLKLFLLIPLAAGLLVLSSMLQPEGPIRVRGESRRVASESPRAESGSGSTLLSSSTTIAFALCGVLALAAGAILVFRRVQGRLDSVDEREIQIKETRRLHGKRLLHMVRAGDKLLLLSDSEQGLGLLCDLTPPDEPLPLEDYQALARGLDIRIGEDKELPDEAEGGEPVEGVDLRDTRIPRSSPKKLPPQPSRAAKARKPGAQASSRSTDTKRPSAGSLGEFRRLLDAIGNKE